MAPTEKYIMLPNGDLERALELLIGSNLVKWEVVSLTDADGLIIAPAKENGNLADIKTAQTSGAQKTQIVSPTGLAVGVQTMASDGLATSTQSMYVRAFLNFFNGTTFDRARGDITNGLDVDVTRQATSFGKTITYAQVSQAGAGTTQLAAASVSSKHKIVGAMLMLDAAGTIQFSDGTITSGAMPILASTPFILPTNLLPFWETGAVNRAISIVTTGGKAFGTVAILTEA